MRGATFQHVSQIILIPFLLTRPMRGATWGEWQAINGHRFLLTRPMRGATTFYTLKNGEFVISTHTPHAGRDLFE